MERTMRSIGPARIARRTFVAVSVAIVGLLIAAASAAGFHIPGATYNLTTQSGSTGSMTVTPDGGGISSVSFTSLPGNTCTFSNVQTTYSTPLPIVNHAFNDTGAPFYFSGSFGAVRAVSGTVRLQTFGPGACDSGNVPFTGNTTASPAGSQECVDAKAQTAAAEAERDAAEKAVAKAKKKVQKADSRKERKRAKKKLKRRKEELKQAEAQVSAAKAHEASVCG